MMEECKDGSLPIWNLTNEIVAKSLLYTPSEEIIIGYIYPITFVLCLIGNGGFLYVVFRIKRMHTITNTYLSHLACADIFYVGVNAVGILYTLLSSPVRYDTFVNSSLGCFLLVAPIYTTFILAICIVTLVTFERYQAIVNPLGHRGMNSKSRTRKLLAICWILSIIVSLGATLIFGKHTRYCVLWPEGDDFQHLPDVIQFCQPIHPKIVVFCELCKSVPFFIALVWNIYMYTRILYALSTGDEQLGKQEGDGVAATQASRFRNQVAKMLIINGAIFFICQIWSRIASIDAIIVTISGEGILTPDQYNAILSLSRAMLFVNGLINPFVYNVTSSLYRKAFRDAFCFCKLGGDQTETIRSVSHPTTSSML
ncbi:pyroglutamylated RF-amide peptide receptor-like [Amphiura filiformis]|uniref:pyroglutamylated RF-amide peptide receptor-like n=1 Tax=Amphiura filiformis TaxID=82378 RepID=UPI003B21DA5F